MTDPREIKRFISEKYGRLGVNKTREVTRLAYEIAVRDGNPVSEIMEGLDEAPFSRIKKKLIGMRYPESVSVLERLKPYLPEIPDSLMTADYGREKELYPSKVYFDRASADSSVLDRMRRAFPDSEYDEIETYKAYIKERKFTIDDYNRRRETLFVIREEYDFIKKCPCTTGCVCCGYYVFNLGFGCPYECTYCYLQEYSNTPGIVIPSNIAEYFSQMEHMPARIGSGEFSDSLAFDEITCFSAEIIDFFRTAENSLFELKTKSGNIGNILKNEPSGNVVIAWSLNPQNIIDENEFFSSDLAGRLGAAAECSKAGFPVAFHFDPVIKYDGWEKDYSDLVEAVFDCIEPKNIKWISMGALRFTRKLKTVIERRFGSIDILNGEMFVGFDGKIRYPGFVRADIYRKMSGWIRERAPELLLYLCMESREVWDESGLTPSWRWKG